MSNSQIDAFIKKMRTPAYAKISLGFKYALLMDMAMRIEHALEKLKVRAER